jgi:hypothetical protein
VAQTYSTAHAAAQGQGYADQPAKITAIEKPRIVQQLDQLAKALSACHDLATNVERAADRILGPVPQDEAKAVPTPPARLHRSQVRRSDCLRRVATRPADARLAASQHGGMSAANHGRSANYRLERSRTRLTQADRVSLAFVAARSYRLLRSSLTRIVRYSRSPFSTGGRPLGFFSMSVLCTNK